jgi:hypothetical protein
VKREASTRASSGADRRNRAGLTLLGLLLAGSGGYGLARGWGVFGDDAAAEPLLSESWRSFVARNENWFWPAAALASLLVAVIALRWLRAQLASAAPRRVDLTHHGDGGTTVVAPTGAAAALARDVERYGGVSRAVARLSGDGDAPEIDLRVHVADSCNVPALRRRIEDDALPRFRRALELDKVDTNIEFRLATPTGPRVS